MSKPTELAWKGLLRCSQYLIQTVGYAVQLKHNTPGATWLGAVGGYDEYVEGGQSILECYRDADWAGHINRKSTSAGVILLNGNAIYSWSRTQRTPALSSGESEFMALVTESLYVRACLEFLLRDQVQIQLRSDSVAGRGIAKRQGLGRVRHLEVQFLWVQQKLAEKQFRLGPVASMVISGDLGTKSLQVNRLSFLLGLLGMVDCHEEFSLVGRDEMQRQQHDQEFREKFKNALKVFRYSFENGSDASSRDNALVKLILQICMVSSLARGADGREDQSIEQFAFDSTDFLFLAFVMLVICAVFFVGILLGRSCARHARNENFAFGDCNSWSAMR